MEFIIINSDGLIVVRTINKFRYEIDKNGNKIIVV